VCVCLSLFYVKRRKLLEGRKTYRLLASSVRGENQWVYQGLEGMEKQSGIDSSHVVRRRASPSFRIRRESDDGCKTCQTGGEREVCDDDRRGRVLETELWGIRRRTARPVWS